MECMRKRCNEAGFTLIQISILLTVAALVMVTMLPSSQLSLTANNASVKKMNAVLTALRQYQVANAILPCPADPTVATGNTSYGIAAANSGPATSCVGSTPSAAYADPTKHIAIGMVPYKTLGLSSDYALDGYGRDVTYAVDTNATASCWSSTSLTGGITVNDNGTNNSAVAVMVSHGADGYGAWLPTQGTGGTGTATRLDSGSTDIFQADNAQVNNGTGSGGLTANGAGQFQSFYRKAPTATFDDVVIYQNPQWSLNALPANSRAALTTYPANGSYSSGQILTFIVTLPTAVTFTGTPRLHLSALGGGANSIGTSNAAYATLASGNGTKTLTFTYTIISTDAAASGIAMTSPIDLNGGTATVSNCVLAFGGDNTCALRTPLHIYDEPRCQRLGHQWSH
jgi:type II secretory pathway pseudopilin PulG